MPAEAYATPSKTAESRERQPTQQSKPYPATSAANEDEMFGPPPVPSPVRATPPAKAVRRPLPGPINMTIGRDPYGVTNATTEKRNVRESLLRRWTDDLRQKVGKTFSKPASSPAAPSEPANLGGPTQREERVGSSAASDTSYNRRWR